MKALLRTQKNEIFRTLLSSGIDEAVIAQIEWQSNAEKYKTPWPSADDGSGIALTLQQDGNILFFYFNGAGDRWTWRGFPLNIGNSDLANYGERWDQLIGKLREWGQKIEAELKTPDLWADLLNIKSGYSFDYEEFKDNEEITAREAHSIKSKLKILELKIIESYGKSDENIKIIKEKFDYLGECIERQGKKDWLYTLIGVLSSLAIAVGVSAANADKFWLLVKSVLGSPIKLLLGN